jgi:hypothetical protein
MTSSAVRLASIDEEFYVRAADLARLLKTGEVEISKLVRASVLVRIPDPKRHRAFLFPCLANVTRFVEYHQNQREEIHRQFLKEKAGRERALRVRIESQNRRDAGELVDKAKLISELEPIVVAFRQTMLARADRLERQLSALKGRKKKVAAIRAADLDALGVLADLFRNGEQRKS